MPLGLPGVPWKHDRRCCCFLGVHTEHACRGAVESPGCLTAEQRASPRSLPVCLTCRTLLSATSRLSTKTGTNLPPSQQRPRRPCGRCHAAAREPLCSALGALSSGAAPSRRPPCSPAPDALAGSARTSGGDTATERAGVLAAAPGLSLYLFTSSLNWTSVKWRSTDVQLEKKRT